MEPPTKAAVGSTPTPIMMAPPAGLPDIPGGVAPWAFQPFAPPSSSLEPKLPGNLIPIPKAVVVPLVTKPLRFCVPSKMIQSDADVKRFVEGPTGKLFQGFLAALCDSIQGKKLSDPCDLSPVCERLVALLDTLDTWIDDIPPAKVALRYGNPAYRDWQQRLQERGPGLMFDLLQQTVREGRGGGEGGEGAADRESDSGAALLDGEDAVAGAAIETFPYLADSFGNATRIDYGTGHEANFMAWLLCLARLGLLRRTDNQAVAAVVFNRWVGG